MSRLRVARAGARADLPGSIGTVLVLVLASALLSVTGVLVEQGLRQPGTEGTLLVTLGSSFASTAVVLVVVVVAATTTLALRRRRRELALLRALGATGTRVRRRITDELLLLGALAAPLGAVAGLPLARRLDPVLREAGVVGPDVVSSASVLPAVLAVLVVMPVALLAGPIAVRETLRASPTTAIRDSAAETRSIGTGRRVAALLTALAGLSTAFSPLVVPGTIGAAAAAASTFLLLGAAALAGPLLVEWTFGRAAAVSGRGGGAATRLAVANLHGFSRRLTAVVVPLALILAIGTTQTTVDHALQEAATGQLTDSLRTDQVATSERALTTIQLGTLADAPGVTEVVPLGEAPAEIRTDADLPDVLAWEATELLVVPPHVDDTLLDPGVTRGDLGDLDVPGTVAISSETALETTTGPGGTLPFRLQGREVDLRVVAVYDHGLGLGHQIVGSATTDVLAVRPATHLALVATDTPGQVARGIGVTTTPTSAYVAATTSPDAAAQRLSTVLTLLLLLFVALASLTALVLLTAGRGPELGLLHRTGATARQLWAMTGVESLLTALAAWAIGTAAVLPAVLGVSLGLLGPRRPALDVASYLALSAGVVALTVLATLLTATHTVRAATRGAPRS